MRLQRPSVASSGTAGSADTDTGAGGIAGGIAGGTETLVGGGGFSFDGAFDVGAGAAAGAGAGGCGALGDSIGSPLRRMILISTSTPCSLEATALTMPITMCSSPGRSE